MSKRAFLESYLYDAVPRTSGEPGRTATLVRNELRAPAFLARRFNQIMTGLMTEVLQPNGLTSAHWGCLVALAREPGLDQRRLCERQSIDPNSASRLIDELEHLGLASRQASPEDRRSNELRLTKAGEKTFEHLRPKILAAQDRVLAPLNEREKGAFLALLARVVEGSIEYARPGHGRRRPVPKAMRAAKAPLPA